MLGDDLGEVLDRIKAGLSTPSDLQALQRALRNGSVTLATGDRAVALGGNANDAIIVTGDGNLVRVSTGARAPCKIIWVPCNPMPMNCHTRPCRFDAQRTYLDFRQSISRRTH